MIDQNEFFDKRVASKDVSGYYLIENGEFAYNKSTSVDAPWGAIKRLDRYKNGVLSTLYIVFKIKSNLVVDSDFLVSYYSTNIWHKGIYEIAAEGARNHGLLNIAPIDFFETRLMIPKDIREQKKIGSYFKEFDTLITLYQRKFYIANEDKVFAWEQRKVIKEVDFIDTGKSKYDIKENGEYEILGSTGVIGYDNTYDYDGDFLLTARVGANAGTLYRHTGKVKITDNTVFLQGKHIDFVFYLLDDFDLKKLSFGSGQPLIKASELKNLELQMPTKNEEKEKIAEYFVKIDTLNTLYQRKCDETKKLKKFMLQKMFPQNGKKVPGIRFSGFSDDWEQRKFGDLFKEYSEKNHTELPTLTIIQGGGTVKREDSDRNLMYDESNLSNYKMVRKNDFIVHLRSFEGGLEKSLIDGIISPAYHTFHSDEADSRFYYPYFRSHEFVKHKLVPHVYGIRDGRSIDIDGMKTIEIPYTSMEEQKKMGDYLDSLDHLITLYQRKCDELKKVKKFMLQNMFV